MPLGWFRAEQFRCLVGVELELDPAVNVFFGPNASGKTSLLEAAFFLGRGRSYRCRQRGVLIRHGQDGFVLAGRGAGDTAPVTVGVRAWRRGADWQAAGAGATGVSAVAELFPVQVVEPETHKLLEEGPSRRRRFMDWGVFHVEPRFLITWKRYHQALRQRNAALKQGSGDRNLAAWEREPGTSGEELARLRRAYLERLADPLRQISRSLLGEPVLLTHARGWEEGSALLDALEASRVRDRRLGATQAGPHRSDLAVEISGRAAKDRVSRGEQKLIAASLVLAQLQLQEQDRPGRSALLLDDPAAELDTENLLRLMTAVGSIRTQLWITSLKSEIPGLPPRGRMFHVERGAIHPA